jgi:Ca2+-binding RTX toxin-like protein
LGKAEEEIKMGSQKDDIFDASIKDQLFAEVNDSLFVNNSQDQLYSGAGTDNFNLANCSPKDQANTVADYQLNEDILNTLGVTDFSDFDKLMLSQPGANILRQIGNQEVANLNDIKFDRLQSNNFTFS